MILYIENPKDSMKKLLKLINEFSTIAGYKTNNQKSIPFITASKRIKYPEINLGCKRSIHRKL